MAFKGSFSITQWDEDTLSERSEGIKVSHASIKQVYSGEMSGESNVEFLMSYQSQMSAKFTGFETFVGVVNGMRGTVTFQHAGKFENGVASSEFISIEGSATGELTGKNLRGNFKSGESGKADYAIEIDNACVMGKWQRKAIFLSPKKTAPKGAAKSWETNQETNY